MDEQSAKQLLSEIRGQEKQAVGGLGIGGPNMNYSSVKPTLLSDSEIAGIASKNRSKNRTSQILQALLLAGSAGAALRGGIGLSRMFNEAKPVPSKTVDMDVLLPGEEKEAAEGVDKLFEMIGMGNPKAKTDVGVPGYLPTMLIGAPLAAYGGWKGMDYIFDSQRKARQQRKTDKAKKDYEQAVLESYKQGSDEGLPTEKLDQAFDKMQKGASWWDDMSGTAKGLAATYALLSGPAAYMYVNDKMKKSSRRAVLEKAMKERARRAAQQQPMELYATPKFSPESKPEEDN